MVLDEILEEIEKIGNIQFLSYTKPLIAVEDVIRIIRSHMEDEPVSNPDKLDNGWIPVEELMPEQPMPVWVTRKMCTGCYVSVDTYHTGKWQYYDDGSVIAWMPKDNMPAPYRPKEATR